MIKKFNIFTKLGNSIKKHKVINGAVIGCLLLALIGVGVIGWNQYQRILNSQKLMELIAENGELTEEQIAEIDSNGGLAEFGTEIIDPNTGEAVVLTQDENGNIVRIVISDSQGNATGNVAPESYSGGNSSGSVHQHTWVAATTVEHHNDEYVVDRVCIDPPGGYQCNTCMTVCRTADECSEHTHIYRHGGWHCYNGVYENVPRLVRAAYDETVVLGYYCSTCGAVQQ